MLRRRVSLFALCCILLASQTVLSQRDQDDGDDDDDDSSYSSPQNSHDAEGSNQNPSNYSPANEDDFDDDDVDETHVRPQVAADNQQQLAADARDQRPANYERRQWMQQQQQYPHHQHLQHLQSQPDYYANVAPQRFFAPPNSVLLANVDPTPDDSMSRYKRSTGVLQPPNRSSSAGNENDVEQLKSPKLIRQKRYAKSYIGPVYTYVKTDKHANFKWGVKHKVGKHYG